MNRIVLTRINALEIQTIEKIDRKIETLREMKSLLLSENDIVKKFAEERMKQQVELDIEAAEKEKSRFFDMINEKYELSISEKEIIQISFDSGEVFCYR